MANTAYDDQGKRPCDTDTRIDILADIKKWVYDISDSAQGLLWLTGDPGSGKSAITASIARECKDDGILWAQFFINRNIGNTTNPASYFPSIARQLADHSPEVALAIHGALKERPSLMDDISQLQAGKLFIESLKVASSTDPSKPVVVIFDGLDETDTTRLRHTAEIFSKALVDLPSNAKVFISSRTEDDIRKPFSATFHMNHVKHIHLDTSANSSIRDVSIFLEKKISEIVDQNELDWLQWPGEERLKVLCKQASGLFIWAVTATKFIQEQVDTWGRECLNDVLDELNTKGMGDVNVLYGTILRLTHKGQTDPWAFERFRRIVGCIVVLQEPLCLADLKSLLNLRKTTSSEPVDIEHYVRRLRTVLVAGTDVIDGQTVPRLHKSFFEFITSERADPHFRVDMDTSNGEVVIQCLRQFTGLSQHATPVNDAIPSTPERVVVTSNQELAIQHHFPPTLRYACRFWTSHLPQAEGTMAGVAVAGSVKLQELYSFASHDGVQPSSVNIAFLPDRKQIVSSSDGIICLWDAESGMRMHVESLLEGHTDSVLSVAFSPDGKQIISGSSDKTLRLWDTQTEQPIGIPFKGHTGGVNSVAFSPDGKQIISGSSDETLRLWDAQTRQPIGLPFKGHTSGVRSVAFSPNGKKIISGSSGGTLRLWDAQTSQPTTFPFNGHINIVSSVAFSPDGRKIISGSLDETLRLWDAQTGQPIGPPFKGHTSGVCSVAFSPNGKQIISGSSGGTIRLWDAQTGLPIGFPFNGHTNTVFSVAFSPDGEQIISGSSDNTLRLWDAQTGQPIGLPFKGHTSGVHSIAFSPDGEQILSGSSDNTLRLWDIHTGQPNRYPFSGHTNKVTSIALSPDGRNVVSASLDGTVRIWNAQTGRLVGPHLEGDINGFISLTFSPDGSRIAGLSLDSTVCLWDVESCERLSLYCKNHINEMTSIAFSPDGRQLMTFRIDGTTSIWDTTNGQPMELSQSSNISFLGIGKSFSFTMEQGWCHREVDGTLLQWLPADNSDFGLWAFIDGKVIRSDRNGSTTIIEQARFCGNG